MIWSVKGWTAILLLGVMVGAALAAAPDLTTAKLRAKETVAAGREMVQHGEQGYLDKMIERARAMAQHGRQAIEATPRDTRPGKRAVDSMRLAVRHAESVIEHGSMGHGDVAMDHARAALRLAEEGAAHLERVPARR